MFVSGKLFQPSLMFAYFGAKTLSITENATLSLMAFNSYPNCHLCWVLFTLSVAIKSIGWVSFCWMSWRPIFTSMWRMTFQRCRKYLVQYGQVPFWMHSEYSGRKKTRLNKPPHQKWGTLASNIWMKGNQPPSHLYFPYRRPFFAAWWYYANIRPYRKYGC